MEEWRDIEGYEGIYKVSSYGRVISYRNNTGLVSKEYAHMLTGSIRNKTSKYKCAYVGLVKDKKMKSIAIHRLVAKAFVPNPEGYKEVNHKDENPLNNNASNLEWCSRKYNVNYGNRTSSAAKTLRNTEYANRLKRSISAHIIGHEEVCMIFESISQASRIIGVHRGSIISSLQKNHIVKGLFRFTYNVDKTSTI